jgi:thioredoxin 1
MKKHILLFALAVAVISCGDAQTTKTKAQSNQEQSSSVVNKVVSKSEFKKLMENKEAQLIDVRTSGEFNGGHIVNAKNIDFNGTNFKSNIDKLDKSKPILVYCQAGGRSGKAAAMMKEMGFKKVYDLEGGYANW